MPPDSATVGASQSVTDQGGVLETDDDPGDDNVSVVLACGPAEGAVSLQPDGSYTYRASEVARGTDSFTYLATDSTGLSAVESETIEIAKGKKKRK